MGVASKSGQQRIRPQSVCVVLSHASCHQCLRFSHRWGWAQNPYMTHGPRSASTSVPLCLQEEHWHQALHRIPAGHQLLELDPHTTEILPLFLGMQVGHRAGFQPRLDLVDLCWSMVRVQGQNCHMPRVCWLNAYSESSLKMAKSQDLSTCHSVTHPLRSLVWPSNGSDLKLPFSFNWTYSPSGSLHLPRLTFHWVLRRES